MKQTLLVGRNIEYGLWEVWPMLWAPKVESILNFIRIFNLNKKAVPQRHTHTPTPFKTQEVEISVDMRVLVYAHARCPFSTKFLVLS